MISRISPLAPYQGRSPRGFPKNIFLNKKPKRLPLGFGFYNNIPMGQGLASKAIAGGLTLETPLLKISLGRQVFHPLQNLDNAGSALANTTAIHQFSAESVQIHAILQGFFP